MPRRRPPANPSSRLCGVDEAGRGPLAGAVFAAAVILDPARPVQGLADSKLLDPARRARLAEAIRRDAIAWAVASATVAEIDELNILRASLAAMARAIGCLGVEPGEVVVDGLHVPGTRWPERAPAPGAVLVAALAGLVAGALSMAAGEYVSVSSQADTEGADLARERHELETSPESERTELPRIYMARGLSPELAAQVADQLTARDALGAHARDELGMSESTRARPIQAALASAAAFAVGAALPLVLAAFWPARSLSIAVGGSSLVLLAVLGGTAARLGGAPLAAGAARVAFWGAVAMASTALVGRLFGTAVQ